MVRWAWWDLSRSNWMINPQFPHCFDTVGLVIPPVKISPRKWPKIMCKNYFDINLLLVWARFTPRLCIHSSVHGLADHTNGRAYVTVLCPSVCRLSVTYVLWINVASYRKNCLRKQIGNDLYGIKWSLDVISQVTRKVNLLKLVTPIRLEPNISKTARDAV